MTSIATYSAQEAHTFTAMEKNERVHHFFTGYCFCSVWEYVCGNVQITIVLYTIE